MNWRRIASIVFVAAALAFLGLLVRSQWSELRTYDWEIEPGWAVLALVGLEVAWLFEADTWRSILAGLGGRLPFGRAVEIWYLSNIMRYIPGNVWQFLGMAEMAAEDGVSRVSTLTSIVLHQAISTAAGLSLVAIYFAVTDQAEWAARFRPVLWLIPLGLLLLQPRLLEAVMNWVLAFVKRPPIRVTLTWGQIWVLLFRYVIVWLMLGLAFAALVRSLTVVNCGDVPWLIATWVTAYTVGYLSMLTPSGLGVREGVMALLLGQLLPVSVAVVVSIVARLWMVAGELLGAGVVLGCGRFDRSVRSVGPPNNAGFLLVAADFLCAGAQRLARYKQEYCSTCFSRFAVSGWGFNPARCQAGIQPRCELMQLQLPQRCRRGSCWRRWPSSSPGLARTPCKSTRRTSRPSRTWGRLTLPSGTPHTGGCCRR